MTCDQIEIFAVPGDDHKDHRIGEDNEYPAVPAKEELETVIEEYPQQIADRVDWAGDVHHCMARSDDDPEKATYNADRLYTNIFNRYRNAAAKLRGENHQVIGEQTLEHIQDALEYYTENVDQTDWEFVSKHSYYF